MGYDLKKEQKKYVHVVCTGGHDEYPGHVELLISDSPYTITPGEIISWPGEFFSNSEKYERYLASLENRSTIAFFTELSHEDYKKAKETINNKISEVRIRNTDYYKWLYDGKGFGPHNNCLDVAKKILVTLCPNQSSIINRKTILTPSQLAQAAYDYSQQHAIIENETDAQKELRLKAARILYMDRLIRKRNGLILRFATLFISTPAITSHVLGEGMPQIPQDSMSNTSMWALVGTAATLVAMVFLILGTNYLKKHNPYSKEIAEEKTPLLKR